MPQIYHNYHATGGTHDAEFTENGQGQWFLRLRHNTAEWKPLLKMTAVRDGDGHVWGDWSGERIYRLIPLTDVNQWRGVSYPQGSYVKTTRPVGDAPELAKSSLEKLPVTVQRPIAPPMDMTTEQLFNAGGIK
jgi:hypothetical protein